MVAYGPHGAASLLAWPPALCQVGNTVATPCMGKMSLMSSCKCKNYMETPKVVKKISVENGYFQAADTSICGMYRRHGFPRPWQFLLLHIRPLMALLMLACIALQQTYTTSMLGVQRTTQTHDPEKWGGKIKVASRWFHAGKDRTTNVLYF